MNVRTLDGRTLSGTAKQIAQQLRSFSFGGDPDLATFLRSEATRSADLGIEIELPDPPVDLDELCDTFVQGALDTGLLLPGDR